MAYENPVLCTESFLHGLVVRDHLASGTAAEIQPLCPVLDLRPRLRGSSLLAEIRHGAILSEPKRELTPAALYELFERHSQCVFDRTGSALCWSSLSRCAGRSTNFST